MAETYIIELQKSELKVKDLMAFNILAPDIFPINLVHSFALLVKEDRLRDVEDILYRLNVNHLTRTFREVINAQMGTDF